MRWVAVVVVGLASACGSSPGDDDGQSASGAGGQGGSTASAGGAGGAAAASGRGGSPAAGTSGNSGSAGTSSLDCTGTFGASVAVLTVPAPTGLGSLALRADELELIYTDTPLDTTNQAQFRRSVRASKDVPFSEGELVEPLNTTCGSSLARTGDLSSDDLRFYFTCYDDFEDPPAAIHLARRASLDAPFVVDASQLGVANSGLTLDTDELMIVTSPPTMGPALLARRRPTTADPFGAEMALSGLDGLITPELSRDGRHLYASSYADDAKMPRLVVADRTGPTEFAAPTVIQTFGDPLLTVGSSAISADCRALYYVSVTTDRVFTVVVMRR